MVHVSICPPYRELNLVSHPAIIYWYLLLVPRYLSTYYYRYRVPKYWWYWISLELELGVRVRV